MSHSKKQYWERRSKGHCVYCDKPAVPGHIFCVKHAKFKSQWRKLQIEDYKLHGRCICCGWPMHPEMDEGYASCVTCRTPRPMRMSMGRPKNENPKLECPFEL